MAMDFSKVGKKNDFPSDGVWFIQEFNCKRYCFWHPDKMYKLNISSTVIAGWGDGIVGSHGTNIQWG